MGDGERRRAEELVTSFRELLELHRELDVLFPRHYEALVERGLPAAIGWFARHREAVVRHAQDEERERSQLFPVLDELVPEGERAAILARITFRPLGDRGRAG